jgi:delta14-sterol reductase
MTWVNRHSFRIKVNSIQFFIGRELNPSIGSFDIKSFNELRPGLILWVLIDISMACEQYVRRAGQITDSMYLVLAFHTWYVLDAMYNEVSANESLR